MHITAICLHPGMVLGAFQSGVCGRAFEAGIASLRCVNPRDFSDDPHRSVDDRPYGGGPGMVLRPEPLLAAVRAARADAPARAPAIFLTPQGKRFNQQRARGLASSSGMILVAGRYEGFDERAVELEADEELSLGDFVLMGRTWMRRPELLENRCLNDQERRLLEEFQAEAGGAAYRVCREAGTEH